MNPTTPKPPWPWPRRSRRASGQAVDVRVAICPPAIFLHRIDERPGRLADRPGGVKTCTPSPTGRTPAKFRAGCSSTPVAPTSSSATPSVGTGWAKPSATVNAKLHAALAAQLIPIVCIGETLEERESDRTEDVVKEQLDGSARRDFARADGGVVLAYEPVWAIGTGLTATPEQAQAVHATIRADLADQKFGEATAGGSSSSMGGASSPTTPPSCWPAPTSTGRSSAGRASRRPTSSGSSQAGRGRRRPKARVDRPVPIPIHLSPQRGEQLGRVANVPIPERLLYFLLA